MNRRAIVVASIAASSCVSALAIAGGHKPHPVTPVAHTAPPEDPAPSPPPPAAPPMPGPGDPRRIVGILDVRVDGVAPEIAASFQVGLEQQLDTKHFYLASRARMRELMMGSTHWTEGCLVGGCLADVRAQTRAELVLLAALTGSGTSFGFVVTLVRTDNGQQLAQKADRCDVCTVNEAMSAATRATVELINAVPDSLPDDAANQRATIAAAVQPVQVRLVAADKRASHVGLALTLVGLAATAGGVAAYVLDHHASYGLATAAAGGGMALGGIVVLTF